MGRRRLAGQLACDVAAAGGDRRGRHVRRREPRVHRGTKRWQIRDLEPLAWKYFGSIAWHPSADRLLYTIADDPFGESDAYTRTLDEDSPKLVESPKKIWDAWWSSDGSRIYATAARGTGTGARGIGDFDIIELPGGRIVASVCGTDGQCR